MDRLACRVMPYPWGSTTSIAAITGRTPTGAPEAELWMGAHPIAPSTLDRGAGPESLEVVVARAPEAELGTAAVAAFGPRLPFLVKVLAAAQPLSLQAHPSAEQARAGFADEENRRIARTDPTRNYKDPSAKPELVCALGPFEALAGFREVGAILDLFRAFGVTAALGVEDALAKLRASPDAHGLEAMFRELMTLPPGARIGDATAFAERAKAEVAGYERERKLVTRLAELYPGDIGIVVALLLEPIHLEEGDAIFLDAGGLHAYLEGTAVEIMASSDNVLRGGLTPKHVDVPELLRVLDFGARAPKILRRRRLDDVESVYDTPARDFRLSVLELDSAREATARDVVGPEILFVGEGGARVVRDGVTETGTALTRGQAIWIPASTRRYTIIAGAGGRATGASPRTVVFRGTTNLS